MNLVKRAIIMAAGVGKRMDPVTRMTPKPLVRIHNVRIIDTVIQALKHNGIHEIYVVVGYLKEQFAKLPEEYPGLTIVENPLFDTCNNISSLYFARDHLEDVMILDGDQIIYNQDIVSREFGLSGYHAVWTEEETNEWLMQVENGRVCKCSRTGGMRGWQLYSISRWSGEDGRKLKKHIEYEFEVRKNTQIYWDDVVMFCHFKDYKLGVYPMKKGDIIELDNLEELMEIDGSYKKYRMEK